MIASLIVAGLAALVLLYIAKKEIQYQLKSTKAAIRVSRLGWQRSEFWRELAWRVGDEHANRICFFLDFYCKLFKLDPLKFYGMLPRG